MLRTAAFCIPNIFTGVVATFLTLMMARYYERLRIVDSERLRVAADVNHHVRNALTTVLYSVHVEHDPELIRFTQDAVDRSIGLFAKSCGIVIRTPQLRTAAYVAPSDCSRSNAPLSVRFQYSSL